MNSAVGLTLLVPFKADEEREAVARAFEEAGGAVVRLDRFWTPPAVEPGATRVYGNETFCLVVAEVLGLHLVSPPDDFIVGLNERWLGREVALTHLGRCAEFDFPRFVKPAIPKAFTARVYTSAEDLRGACQGLPPETPLIASEVVRFASEVRAFLLDGNILDVSPYEGTCNLDDARSFLVELARNVSIPRAVVLDVGLLESGRWVCIEANATWGAGLNGCDARRVLPAIAAACS